MKRLLIAIGIVLCLVVPATAATLIKGSQIDRTWSLLSGKGLGIGVSTPRATLDISGSVSGKTLTLSSLRGCDTIDTTSTGMLLCGTDATGAGSTFGTGNVITIGDSRYVNQSGDTMTGALVIQNGNTHSATATPLLNARGTISGATLYANSQLRSSGSLAITRNGAFNTNNANIITIGSVVGNENYPGIWFGSSDPSLTNYAFLADVGSLQTILNAPTSGSLDFRVGNATLARISSTGNFGIGSTSPKAKLDVVGTISGTGLQVNGTGNFRDALNVNTLGTASAVLTLTGDTPHSASVDLKGYADSYVNYYGAGSTSTLNWRSGVASNFGFSNAFVILNGTTSRAALAVDKTTNNVGIGAIAPGAQFVVSGSTVIGNNIGTRAAKAQLDVLGTISGSSLTISNAAGTNYLMGNVGIGKASPSYPLDVVGNTQITNGSILLTGDYLVYWAGTGRISAAADIVFASDAFGEFSRYSASTGRMGIGTTVPKAKLDVVGTISGSALTISGLNAANCDVKSTNGVFSCGTDTGTTYTAGQGLTLTSNVFRANATLSGTLVRFTTVSGSTLFSRTSLLSSGSLVVDTTGLVKGNLTTRGTLSGAALTVMAGTNYLMGNTTIGTLTNNGSVKLGVNGTISGAALTIMSGTSYLRGNVGIGKTSPATKLDVVGTASASLLTINGGSAGANYILGNLGIGQTTTKATVTVNGGISGSSLTIYGTAKIPKQISLPLCAGNTACATGSGTAVRIDRMLNNYFLSGAYIYSAYAGTTGTMTVQIRNMTQAKDMMTTFALGSTRVLSGGVVNSANNTVTANDILMFNISAVHTTPAKGATVDLIFWPK